MNYSLTIFLLLYQKNFACILFISSISFIDHQEIKAKTIINTKELL